MYDIFMQLMEEKGVTAYRVAKDTGITQATLSRWKTGKVSPSIETLQVLAEYFGVTIDYLMGNTQASEQTPPETQKAPTLNKKDELLDDDFIVLQRNLQNIPEAERKRIIRNFRDTVDIYLNRLGVENEKEGK